MRQHIRLDAGPERVLPDRRYTRESLALLDAQLVAVMAAQIVHFNLGICSLALTSIAGSPPHANVRETLITSLALAASQVAGKNLSFGQVAAGGAPGGGRARAVDGIVGLKTVVEPADEPAAPLRRRALRGQQRTHFV